MPASNAERDSTPSAATPGHIAAVRTHLIGLLTPDQPASLADVSETVLTHLEDQYRSSSG